MLMQHRYVFNIFAKGVVWVSTKKRKSSLYAAR